MRELVIRPTLHRIGLYSEAAENLLTGTYKHESAGGYYLKQIEGPALGPFQMEPKTHDDIWEHFLQYREDLGELVVRECAYRVCKAEPVIAEELHNQLITNFAYSAAMARIHYYRVPDKLPEYNDIEGLAHYWKEHYNTHLGAGTPEDFINAYTS